MTLHLPLQIYNLIDRETTSKILRFNLSEVPSLIFIASLISKIEKAKINSEAEEFKVL